jgi:hypothetical protein
MYLGYRIKVVFTNYKGFHEIQHKDPRVVTERKWHDGRALARADQALMAELAKTGKPIYYLADDVSFSILLTSPSGEVVNTQYPASCVKDTVEIHVFKNNLLALANALALVHGKDATHGMYGCTIAIGPIDGEPILVHGEVKVKIIKAVGSGFLDHQLLDGNGVLISTYPPEDRFKYHPRGLAVQQTLPHLPL